MSLNFEVHPSARASINAIAADALSSVEKVEVVQQRSTSNPSWRPGATFTITDADLLSEPTMWLPQPNGSRAYVFMYEGNDCFGLSEINHRKLSQLANALLKIKWVQKSVSEDYISDAFVAWARRRYSRDTYDDFLDCFVAGCRKDIVEQTVLAPVQHLQVQEAFAFGPTRIVPMDAAYFDAMEASLRRLHDQPEAISKFMGEIRSQMNRCSAVEVKVFAEPKYAQDAALQVCEDAVGLLRFFSAATCGSRLMSPVALLDGLSVPKVHLLTGHQDEGLTYSSRVKVDLDYWLISKAEADLLAAEDLNDVGRLVDIDELSDFEKAVRSSILAFTRAVTFADLPDRLVFAFSAIEGLMLRNASEPIQQNVGERVAFLISSEPAERRAIVDNFKKAYGMRSHYIHHRVSALDALELDRAFLNIRAALSCAIANLSKFTKREDFIEAIERRKFGYA